MSSSSSKGYIVTTDSAHDFISTGEASIQFIKPQSGTMNIEGQMAIGTEQTAHNASSALTVDSSSGTKFIAIPTATATQLTAAAALTTKPATGSIAYDSTNNKLCVFDGSSWLAVH